MPREESPEVTLPLANVGSGFFFAPTLPETKNQKGDSLMTTHKNLKPITDPARLLRSGVMPLLLKPGKTIFLLTDGTGAQSDISPIETIVRPAAQSALQKGNAR